MKQMKIGKSGIEASALGLGTWAIGGDSSWGPSDDNESIKTIHRARELGISLIDTAPAYGLGHSEEVVGKALAGHRDQYVLATKCGIRWDIDEGGFLMERDGVKIVRNASPKRLSEEIDLSLKRLQTDYIDIYIVHWQAIEEYPIPISDTMGYLMELKQQGKIRAIGASNLNSEQFIEYVNNGQLDLIQEKYSILDRVVEETFFGFCEEHGVTFQAYSPLERGVLTGKYTPASTVNMGLAKKKIKWYEKENLEKVVELKKKWQPLFEKYGCSMTELVLAWTLSQGTGNNVNVLCGARKISQIEENVGGGNISIDSEDLASMRRDVEGIL
jgi:methylglyoxal reductase